MMRALTVAVDVRDLTRAGVGARRIAGVLDDNQTIAVCAMQDGDRIATPENEFSLADAKLLAEACLSGDRRALTTPGLARILSSTVAVLFSVSTAAGAFQRIEDPDGGDAGYLDDQPEAGSEEDPGR
ncbi:hypothetical protein MPL1032_190135 [Mesorhizobium plurifarium]|uniref:Uncharacterized protein n=1 Tax=Mesorhizobium plurifarium TaxID=69974 RepID=A0A0K2VVK2_MESPL|nr:hypothetical protein MPL1032_190135 [Mesorhizobium plurifarium]